MGLVVITKNHFYLLRPLGGRSPIHTRRVSFCHHVPNLESLLTGISPFVSLLGTPPIMRLVTHVETPR
jgi:hypothetical protein